MNAQRIIRPVTCLALAVFSLPPAGAASGHYLEPGLSTPAQVILGDPPQTPKDLTGLIRPHPRVGGAGLAVDIQNRGEVANFYNTVFLASENVPAQWTGNTDTCVAGSVSQAYQDATLLRINYFRAMAGVPAAITLDPVYSAKAQQAALMMLANNSLSHTPPASWRCYTAEGAEAAGKSNISLGHSGADAVLGQMADDGANNGAAGHRRWILYPQTQFMGAGNVQAATWQGANALWVFDGNMWNTRPAVRDDFVSWPPPGYVPYQLVFKRWSFSYPGADFSNASVTMQSQGQPVSLSKEPLADGYGENTLVWIPYAELGTLPAGDTAYTVTIQNVLVQGTARNFSYTVTVMDPSQAGTGTPAVSARLGNISTRANIGGGQNDAFAGFVLDGGGTRQVMLRGIAKAGGVDPKLTLLKLNGTTWESVAVNDEWEQDMNASGVSALPSNLRLPDAYGNDAGLLLNLTAGVYSAQLSSIGGTGLEVVGVDATGDTGPLLGNISTRAYISGGQNDAFAGFVISGGTLKVMLRGIAKASGVDPKLTLLKLNGTAWEILAANDEWELDGNAAAISALPSNLQLPDAYGNDAGMLLDLPAGVYSVQLSSTSGPGLAVVGVDAVQDAPPSSTGLARQNNTVVDYDSRLMWQDDTHYRTAPWTAAQAYCEDLTLDGHADWRLPTQDELAGIIAKISVSLVKFLALGPEWCFIGGTSDPFKAVAINNMSTYGLSVGDKFNTTDTTTRSVRCVRQF